MGIIMHDAVIITVDTYMFPDGQLPDVDAFRESLPENFARLVIGPVETAINGDFTYAFLPDGSKEGWAHSDAGDYYRRQFIDLFKGASRYPDSINGVAVNFGGDNGKTVRASRISRPSETNVRWFDFDEEWADTEPANPRLLIR